MLFIIFILSVICAFTIFTKHKIIALYFLVFHYFLIDVFNAFFDLNSSILGIFSKSYREILFIIVCLYFIVNIKKFKDQYLSCILVVIFSIFLLIISGIKNGFSAAVIDWRYSCFPIFLAVFLSFIDVLTFKNLKKMIVFLTFLTFLTSIFAIYQYVFFDGNYQKSWRYEFLVDQNLKINSDYMPHMAQYQLVRNDNLRSSGLFLSALHFAYIASFSSFYYFMKGVMEFRDKKILTCLFFLLMFFICFLGVYVSQVRAAYLIFLLSFVGFVFSIKWGDRLHFYPHRSFGFSFVIMLLFLILLMFFSDNLDDSILGRIPQYLYMIDNFKMFGWGLGAYTSTFDSYYIYGLMTSGVLLIFLIYLVFRIFFRFFENYTFQKKSENEDIIILAYCSITPAFLFSVMQHFSGSLYYMVIWIIVFSLINNMKLR